MVGRECNDFDILDGIFVGCLDFVFHFKWEHLDFISCFDSLKNLTCLSCEVGEDKGFSVFLEMPGEAKKDDEHGLYKFPAIGC